MVLRCCRRELQYQPGPCKAARCNIGVFGPNGLHHLGGITLIGELGIGHGNNCRLLALKRAYRDRIRTRAGGPVLFVHLAGTKDIIGKRMNQRPGTSCPPPYLTVNFLRFGVRRHSVQPQIAENRFRRGPHSVDQQRCEPDVGRRRMAGRTRIGGDHAPSAWTTSQDIVLLKFTAETPDHDRGTVATIVTLCHPTSTFIPQEITPLVELFTFVIRGLMYGLARLYDLYCEMIMKTSSTVLSLLRIAMTSILHSLSACATRPPSSVLAPVQVKNDGGCETVTVLSVTNRVSSKDKPGFEAAWSSDKLTYDRYEMSVPPDRHLAAITYPDPKPDLHRQFAVTGSQTLTEHEFVSAATRSRSFDGTVALFIHGYNYSHQEALFRAAQLAADSKASDSLILFSWPSQASITGYLADRDTALSSRSDLEAVVTSLANPSRVKQVLLLGHSMGGFLLMETVRQLKLEHRDDILRKLVIILAAPDIDVDVFLSQLRDIGELETPITVLVSKTDRALAVSSFLGADRARIGQLDVEEPAVREAAVKYHVRIVDIGSLKDTDGVG